MKSNDKVSVLTLKEMKEKGEKIACLTAYDWLMASILDAVGIDLILVGDSGAMVFAGHDTTLPITMDQMVYHTQSVARGVHHALLITDMPFLSYQVSPQEAIRNTGRFLKEGGADGVKIEGGEHMAETVNALTQIGIPVMGHLGLTPQSIRILGGYRLQGRDSIQSEKLKQDAKIMDEAGAFALVLEKIPASLAEEITQSISIPTIGIGAGPKCDGQILVTHDMLGLFKGFKPKFVRHYANLDRMIRRAVKNYKQDVRTGVFPSSEESY
jgi:3-methyl-2-oxobutanoate hydroxymethyltransferase